MLTTNSSMESIDMDKKKDKLAQDVSKAIAANMSYGKWKAMQEHPVKAKEEIPEGWKVCLWCGKPYKPKTRRTQFYCEAVCQREAQIERDRQRRAKRAAYMRERRAQGRSK